MNTLIIFGVIFAIISVIIIILEDGIANIIGGIFGTLFILAILYGIVMIIGITALHGNPKYTSWEYKELPIQSLINKGGFSINGSFSSAFTLGTGTISGGNIDYYVSYAQFPQGLLRVKVDASNAYIKETNDESPKIINYWVRKIWTGYKNKWLWNSAPRTGEWEVNRDGEKIVIVPKNTVYKDLFKIQD